MKPNFKVEEVALDNMFVDFTYQRPTRTQFVQEKVESFRPELVNVLVVSKRKDGRCAVVDGGHRYMIMRELGIPSWLSAIHEKLSMDAEADMFVEVNFARNSVRPYERFTAMIEAKIPMALALRDCVAGEKLSIATTAVGEHNISAIASLEEVFLRLKQEATTSNQRHHEVRNWAPGSNGDGAELLGKTLGSLRDAWSERDGWTQAKAGSMVRGVARFLVRYPLVTQKEMSLVLKHSDPLRVQLDARALQKPGAGTGKGRPVELVIETLYKKHGNKDLMKQP